MRFHAARVYRIAQRMAQGRNDFFDARNVVVLRENKRAERFPRILPQKVQAAADVGRFLKIRQIRPVGKGAPYGRVILLHAEIASVGGRKGVGRYVVEKKAGAVACHRKSASISDTGIFAGVTAVFHFFKAEALPAAKGLFHIGQLVARDDRDGNFPFPALLNRRRGGGRLAR